MPKADFSQIKTRADQLKASYGSRDTDYEEYEKMYMLQDDELQEQEWVKKTISPDARNSLLGLARLLGAADPTWSVPEDEDTATEQLMTSKLERFADAAWRQCGREKGQPPNYDASKSALLYDEVHIAVVNTKELAAATPGDPRAKAVSSRTPLMFEIMSSQDLLCPARLARSGGSLQPTTHDGVGYPQPPGESS